MRWNFDLRLQLGRSPAEMAPFIELNVPCFPPCQTQVDFALFPMSSQRRWKADLIVEPGPSASPQGSFWSKLSLSGKTKATSWYFFSGIKSVSDGGKVCIQFTLCFLVLHARPSHKLDLCHIWHGVGFWHKEGHTGVSNLASEVARGTHWVFWRQCAISGLKPKMFTKVKWPPNESAWSQRSFETANWG